MRRKAIASPQSLVVLNQLSLFFSHTTASFIAIDPKAHDTPNRYLKDNRRPNASGCLLQQSRLLTSGCSSI
jgi:hypothetical protein